jgi:hypothetical protein
MLDKKELSWYIMLDKKELSWYIMLDKKELTSYQIKNICTQSLKLFIYWMKVELKWEDKLWLFKPRVR